MQERKFELWGITAEQADKIRAGDVDARNDFYFKNYDILERIAKTFARRHNAAFGRPVYDVAEMLAQLYVDLPFLYWKNGAHLLESIRHCSFTWSAFGGYAQRKIQGLSVKYCPWTMLQNKSRSLDELVKVKGGENDELRLIDKVADGDTPETLLEKKMSRETSPEELAELFADLIGKRELEYLKLYLTGISPTKIAVRMGVCTASVTSLKNEVHRKLVLNYETVLARLEQFGITVPDCYKSKPADFETMLEALEKKRARDRVRDEDRKRKRYTSEEERRAAIVESHRKWNLKRKERREQERAARAGGNA